MIAIRFSVGRGVRDTHPKLYEVATFAELASLVRKAGEDAAAVVTPDGSDPALLKRWKQEKPLLWMAQPFAGDGSRKAVNAQPWPLLLLDIDRVADPEGGHMGLAAKLLVSLRAKVPCFGWSTLSHSPEAPALRIVIGLDSPVTSEEGALLRDALLAAVAADLGVSVGGKPDAAIYIDPTMQDGGHIAFLPVGECAIIALHEKAAPLPVAQWLPYARTLKAQRDRQQQPVRVPVVAAPSPDKVVAQTPEMIAELGDTLRQLDQHCPTCVHNRRDWLKVLMSLKSFGWDDAVMEPIAREWSQRSPKFDAETWARDWYSIKPEGAVSAASLYYLAGKPKAGREADLSAFTTKPHIGVVAARQGSHSALYVLPEGVTSLPLETDDGAARALIAWLDGAAMFTRGTWHVFDGVRWRCDTGGYVMAGKLKAFAEALFAEARQGVSLATRTGDGHAAKAWETRGEVARGLLREKKQTDVLASAATSLYRADATLDREHDLLCVPNGIVDTRTGDLLPPSPSHMFSLVAGVAYDPKAKCPRFERFMHEVQPNGNLREYAQRFLGYCLTGHMSEEVMGVWTGRGANGKSVLGDVVSKVLGEFACAVDPALLTGKAPARGQASPEVTKLMGRRLAYANESREGDRLNDGTVKQLVSTERMEARPLYNNPIEFYPTAKIVLRTNHKPEVRDDSEGLWRRLHLLLFGQSFKGREDPKLVKALDSELPGILAWMVRGAVEWHRIGLSPPGAVTEAVGEYRKENDVVGEWMRECTVPAPEGGSTSTVELFESFQREMGRHIITPIGFARRLAEKGAKKSDSRTQRGFALLLKLGSNGSPAPDTTAFKAAGTAGAAWVNPMNGQTWSGLQ